MEQSAIILAAGKGKRMQSGRNKVLHHIGGRPIVEHVLRACQGAGISNLYVVVGRDADDVQAALGDGIVFVTQAEQLGTGHATQQVEPYYQGEGTVLIMFGDTPLIRPQTLRQLLSVHSQHNASATLLTARLAEPGDYGRVIRTAEGHVSELVEARDATPEQLAVNEINTGIACFAAKELFRALNRITNDNAQGEYYLTDVFSLLAAEGKHIATCLLDDMQEALGINDRIRQAEADTILRRRTIERLMLQGVTFLAPETTLVDDAVEIGRDTIIYPGCILEGNTVIGQNSQIGPSTRLTDCHIGSDCVVENSVGRGAVVGNSCQIGPYAYLRPQTALADGVKVGDFVELKNAQVGAGTKIPHLSYVGDVTIGRGANLGAGTILVNYDGEKKHHSHIEDNAFIGCNSNLVSPVHIGQGAYIAAGSTITEDVPADSLAIARERQVNKADWVSARRSKGK